MEGLFKEFKYRFTYPNVSFIYETVFERAEEEYLSDLLIRKKKRLDLE